MINKKLEKDVFVFNTKTRKRANSFFLVTVLALACLLAASHPVRAQVPFSQFIEAEDGTLSGTLTVQNAISGYSGYGYVGSFGDPADRWSVAVYFPATQQYSITLRACINGGFGYKVNNMQIDNNAVIAFTVNDTGFFYDSTIELGTVSEGWHTISIVPDWGWLNLDAITVQTSQMAGDAPYVNATANLITPNASEKTRNIMNYLKSVYGKRVLSGQTAESGAFAEDMQRVVNVTGKYPAVMALDFMDFSSSRMERGARSMSTQYAIEWGNLGGLMAIQWHWNAPSPYLYDEEVDGRYWWQGFYTGATFINLGNIMAGIDINGYNLLLADMDIVAQELKILQENNVTVLWRPLHEAAGGWFWWGASGAEPYKALWNLMYERFTYVHGLTNLIWVWNGEDEHWYPGNDRVDIIGTDIYAPANDHSSQVNKFIEMVRIGNSTKMVALTENGSIPNPDAMIYDNTYWSWFCTWSGTDFGPGGATSADMFYYIYNHPLVVTLDELPDFNGYIPNPGTGNDITTLEAYNLRGAFIRHSLNRARVDSPVIPFADGEWRIVDGLADGTCVSIESVNLPGYYLRHRDGEIWLDANNGSGLFAEDATWRTRPGLASQGGISFESYNLGGTYIRHSNGLLFLAGIYSGLDMEDATFLASNISLESSDIIGSYIRHSGFRARIDAGVLHTPDAQFRIVPGLYNQACASIESVTFPGYYLRHRGGEIWLDQYDGTSLFQQDATWVMQRGAGNSNGLSFESYNVPGSYVGHINGELFSVFLDQIPSESATFYVK